MLPSRKALLENTLHPSLGGGLKNSFGNIHSPSSAPKECADKDTRDQEYTRVEEGVGVGECHRGLYLSLGKKGSLECREMK